MLRISKEGHSFPHYSTCRTCIEDFDEIAELTIDSTLRVVWDFCDKKEKEALAKRIDAPRDTFNVWQGKLEAWREIKKQLKGGLI